MINVGYLFLEGEDQKGELNLKTYPSDQIIKESKYTINRFLYYKF